MNRKETRDQSKSPWRQLRVYDMGAYVRFEKQCRAKNSSVTRELNNFIQKSAAKAGKLEGGHE